MTWTTTAPRCSGTLLLATLGTTLGASACADPHELRWGYAFERAEDQARARYVEAEIRRGDCAGSVVYRAEIRVAAPMARAPDTLGPGRYCLWGAARDEACDVFAEGSTTIALPEDADTEHVVLLRGASLPPACGPDACRDGRCEGEDDAGARDAGRPDAAPRDAPSDAREPTDAPPPPDASCPSGRADCDGVAGNGCEASLSSDGTCGSCSVRCGDARCESMDCVCRGGLTVDRRNPSDVSCRDTQRDSRHCGAPGMACRDDQTCAAGVCVCRPRLADIGGECVDPQSDPDHCGPSRAVCSAAQLCSLGACAATCDTGLTSCVGTTGERACVDLANDPLHCGTCSRRCPNGQVCVGGACRDYRPATDAEEGRTCTTCTGCDVCEGDRPLCCTYGPNTVCVHHDALACPAL